MPALGVGLKGVPQPSANLCHRGAGFIDQPDPEQKAMVHAVSVVLFYLIWLERTESLQTRCWREQDSNHRSPRKAPAVLAMSALVRAEFPLAGNQAEAT
jgi:hypothetical protein